MCALPCAAPRVSLGRSDLRSTCEAAMRFAEITLDARGEAVNQTNERNNLDEDVARPGIVESLEGYSRPRIPRCASSPRHRRGTRARRRMCAPEAGLGRGGDDRQ